MRQVCKECDVEFDSFIINDYCNKCEEKLSLINEKIHHQLEQELTLIKERVLIKPEFFKVMIRPDIKNLEIKTDMRMLNGNMTERVGYEVRIISKIKRHHDEFEIMGEYLIEFEEKIPEGIKKDQYKKKKII